MARKGGRLESLDDLFDDEFFRRVQWPKAELFARVRVARWRARKGFVPGAVVKVVPGTISGRRQVRDFLYYVSEKGALDVETQDGVRLSFAGEDKGDLDAVVDEWAVDFANRENTRDALHLMFSTPTTLDWEAYREAPAALVNEITKDDGRIDWEVANERAPELLIKTNRAAIHATLRELLPELFPDHAYLWAVHDDRAHRHVHVAVKPVSFEGERLSPGPDDLQRYRDAYARVARRHGIVMDPSPRRYKGLAPKRTLGTKALYEAAHDVSRDLADIHPSQRADVRRERAFKLHVEREHAAGETDWRADELNYAEQGEAARAAYLALAEQMRLQALRQADTRAAEQVRELADVMEKHAREMAEWVPRREREFQRLDDAQRQLEGRQQTLVNRDQLDP